MIVINQAVVVLMYNYNSETMKCNITNIKAMSQLCLDTWEFGLNGNSTAPEGCFLQSTIGTITSIWCMIHGFIGITGNLLTLLAIPYAARKKKWVLVIFFSAACISLYMYYSLKKPDSIFTTIGQLPSLF